MRRVMWTMPGLCLALLPALALTQQRDAGSPAAAQGAATRSAASPQLKDPKAADVTLEAHIYEPQKLEATEERLRALKLPPGFRIQKFAEGLGKPRMMAVADDGTVYVTRREPGDLLMLRDTNGDGVADTRKVIVQKPQLHGMALKGNKAWFVTVEEVFTADRKKDGTFGTLRRIMSGLPAGGQHANRTLAVGPDGMLYVSVGSTCNACKETTEKSATLLRAKPDGSGVQVFARGLRNTIGFAWEPRTGKLYGLDHGIDWLGDDEQKEELNLLEQGQDYGWPYIYEDGKFNPQDDPPEGTTLEQLAAKQRAPVLTYTAHSAPMQLAFYKGQQFPEEYRQDAFATMRGSWNRKPPSGYELVRIRFQDGKPTAIEPFITGFLTQQDGKHAQFGRPVGLAVAPDGALLFSDDTGGVLYRVSYSAGGTPAPR